VSFLPRNRSATIGVAIVAALVLFAILGPLLTSHDPYQSDFEHGLAPTLLPVGPNGRFWLGADRLFRDELSRLAVGARTSLFIGLTATLIATAIGLVAAIPSVMAYNFFARRVGELADVMDSFAADVAARAKLGGI